MMIELGPITLILLIEVLVAMVLLVFGFLLFSRNKNSSEQVAAHKLIDKLEETKNFKIHELKQIMMQQSSIEEDKLEQLLGEINQNERVLYQQVIQLFLSRDEKLLQKINQTIEQLSEPYSNLLSYSSIDVEDKEKLEVAENKIHKLTLDTERLDQQLTEAIKTMDEISAEYTRVFTGTQTEEELEKSSRKMLMTYKKSEQRIRASFKNVEL
jgi:hypothetical protein